MFLLLALCHNWWNVNFLATQECLIWVLLFWPLLSSLWWLVLLVYHGQTLLLKFFFSVLINGEMHFVHWILHREAMYIWLCMYKTQPPPPKKKKTLQLYFTVAYFFPFRSLFVQFHIPNIIHFFIPCLFLQIVLYYLASPHQVTFLLFSPFFNST